MYKILFVDDDKQYQEIMTEMLEQSGYQVVTAQSAYEGLTLFKNDVFNLIISDLKMDTIDGNQFVTLLRKLDKNVKVIIVTGSNSDQDELKSLELFVDDYIKKPVGLDIFLQRVKNVLTLERNIAVDENLRSVTENIVIDVKARRVYKDEEMVELTRREFDLLCLFLKNKNMVLDREQIIKKVWVYNGEETDLRTVDTHVKKIRAKLSLTALYSVRGIGYEWVE